MINEIFAKLICAPVRNLFFNNLYLSRKAISGLVSTFLLGSVLVISAGAASASKCPVPAPPPSDTKCYSGAGCLDTAFDFDGLVTTYLNASGGNAIRELLIQPDGKIVAVGEMTNSSTATDFFVARYNTDGSLDTSFGDPDPLYPLLRRGYASVIFSSGNDWVKAGALQPDGKILIGGASNSSGAIVRLNTDGTLDNTFDGDGKQTISSPLTFIYDIALQSDGKILLGGAGNFTVARLNTNGTLDTTFGTGGKFTVNPSSSTSGSGGLWALNIQRVPAGTGEERIVVGGYAKSSTRVVSTFALMRLKPNGSVDTTFGGGGRSLTSFYDNGDQIRNLAVDSSNRIVASGLTHAPSSACTDADFAVARYTENGILDPSFSADGKASIDIYGGVDYQYGLFLQSDDKPVLGGIAYYTDANRTNVTDFALVRFKTDGTPDSTFGPGFLGTGVVTTRIPGENSSGIYSVTRQSDGMILAGGVAGGKPAVARYFP